jgi:hypothetical protein
MIPPKLAEIKAKMPYNRESDFWKAEQAQKAERELALQKGQKAAAGKAPVKEHEYV